MTPKEKALELIDRYYLLLKESKGYYDLPNATKCALIAVDEIIWSIKCSMTEYWEDYWEQVKTEINKL